MDRIDHHILRELKRDARQSNIRLAERVGLSPSACLRRVQELERTGVLTGYRAVVSRKALGIGLVAFITIGLSDHSLKAQEAFTRAMADAPEVVECHNVTGTIEYILRVEVADIAAYKAFHTQVLGTLAQVTSITSYIVLETSKDERG